VNRAQRRKIGAINGGWGPWEHGTLPEISEARIAEIAAALGQPEARVREAAGGTRAVDAVMLNAVYQVNIQRMPEAGGWPEMIYLSIKRRDKAPIGVEHFRDFQRIKNELVGPENEAIELYPKESRLVDIANQYHLFVLASPAHRYPFGFGERMVSGVSAGGAVQMPFDDPPGD